MTQLAQPHAGHLARYRHEALLWRGIDGFLAHAVPFVTSGLAAGEPVMVAVTSARAEPLHRALGPDAGRVRFVDMGTLGHNPARIIPAWLDFIAEHRSAGVPLRGIGEPIWAGRRPAEVVECQIHEAMLDLAIPPDTPLWLLCPYDADALDAAVLDEAARTHAWAHPTEAAPTSAEEPRPEWPEPGHGRRLMSRALPEPTAPVERLDFRRGDLGPVRQLVTRHAVRAGLDAGRIDDLALSINEVAANSLDHGGGRGVLRAWCEPGALVFEVQDRGRIEDPLVGRLSPLPGQPRGRGLWMVNRLCDLLQIRSGDAGTTVRVLTWL